MAVLVVLLAARVVSTVCWGGLAIRFVWGLGGTVLRFLDPKNLCGIYRCLYRQLGTESAMRTVRMDFPVPNYL